MLTDKTPLQQAEEILQVRIAGHIQTLHRDFPTARVSSVEVSHHEQSPGGNKYVLVKVQTVPR
jgi:hypothetical protein